MRFLIAFVLLVVVANAQTLSDTNSNTNSNSWTPSWTNSPSNSWTNSNSNSWTNTNSNSWTSSGTWTKSGTNSNSWTNTPSKTGTATSTYPQPPAPVGLVNSCGTPVHIITVCLQWSDPATYSFNYYRVYVTGVVSGITTVHTTTQPQINIDTLNPATAYTIQVEGVDTTIGVYSAKSTAISVTTAAADPKRDPTRDIQNFACAQGTNPNTGRVSVTCTWTAAADTVIHVNLKAHCVSATREPILVRKKLWGAKATATSVLFAVNRDSADCNFYARFYYQRRPTTRHHVQLTLA